MAIRTVGVLGCGLMGAGIAQVCAAAGYKTIVREVDDILLNNGIGRIRKFLDDGVAKGKTTPESRDATLCITELAAAPRRPDRVAGLHFFNPVPIMKLVEVIRALTTSGATYDAVFT